VRNQWPIGGESVLRTDVHLTTSPQAGVSSNALRPETGEENQT